MKRLLYVLIISGLTATLACAPASRKQAAPAKPVTLPAKPTSPSNPANPGSSTPTTPGTSTQPGTPGTGGATTDTPAITNTTGPTTLGSLNILRIASEPSADGSLALKIVTQDGNANTEIAISVDPTGNVTEGQGTSSSKFTCDSYGNGTSTTGTQQPADCADGKITFSLKGQDLSAAITKITDLQIDELIETPTKSLTGGATTFVKDSSKNKANVGTAQYHKVVLSYQDKQVIGLRASFIMNGSSNTGNPDDIQVSKDSNVAVAIFGLPTVDAQGNSIKTSVAETVEQNKKDGKAPVPRQEETKPILYQGKTGEDEVRYSVGIETTPFQVLILNAHHVDKPVTPPAPPVTPPAPPVVPPIASHQGAAAPKVPAVENVQPTVGKQVDFMADQAAQAAAAPSAEDLYHSTTLDMVNNHTTTVDVLNNSANSASVPPAPAPQSPSILDRLSTWWKSLGTNESVAND